jgi:hypothetical protein
MTGYITCRDNDDKRFIEAFERSFAYQAAIFVAVQNVVAPLGNMSLSQVRFCTLRPTTSRLRLQGRSRSIISQAQHVEILLATMSASKDESPPHPQ